MTVREISLPKVNGSLNLTMGGAHTMQNIYDLLLRNR